MQKYIFTQHEQGDGILVHVDDLYNEAKGYGFIPLDQPLEKNGDFFKATAGWIADSVSKERYPLRFRAKVKEKGNYKVTVTIEGKSTGVDGVHLYTGRRNLVLRDIHVKPREVFVHSFYTHVGAYIPIMGKPAREDNSVYVSLLGQEASLSAVEIEKADVATIYIGGDSIVADYEARMPYNPLTNFGAWGQYLLQYIQNAAVDNQAHGGMTTNCFRDDGHLDIILENIRPGDIFLFQFGHNDQKRRNLKAYGGYTHNLRWYIQKIRSLGATPIIVTSMSRIPAEDEHGYYDLLKDYADACLRVGYELDVDVIDLHQYSFELFCQMDAETIKGYFMDAAHTNDYGGMLIAEFIAKDIMRQNIPGLREKISNRFMPLWAPDESLRPQESILPTQKEEAPVLTTDLPELPYIDCQGIEYEEVLKKAMHRGLLDPCVKFFHPFDEMPRAQFLYVFFKAIKGPASRGYTGKYCDIYRYEFDSGSVQKAIDANIIDPDTTPDQRFRPDDGLTGGELISMVIRGIAMAGFRELGMDACEEKAKRLGWLWEGYQRHKPVNRAQCISVLVQVLEKNEKTISLKGKWQYQLDPQDMGEVETWFQERFSEDTLMLPGTLCENGIGKALNPEQTLTPESVRSLKARYDYVGACWYQKMVTVPKGWNNQRVVFSIERVMMASKVWIDNQFVGTIKSLIGAHEYDLTAFIKPGQTHRLTVMLDNRDPYHLGLYGHSYTNETQTLWNGMVGAIELKASQNLYMDQVMIFADAKKQTVTVKGKINQKDTQVGMPSKNHRLKYCITHDDNENVVATLVKTVACGAETTYFEHELVIEAPVEPWNEWNPKLYRLHIELEEERTSISFGFRKLQQQGRDMLLNGHKMCLRGNLECVVHPLTGYPPCDEAYWMHIMKVVKAYGMNHLRFHSNCPPEAAFVAADRCGIYLQVEGPIWLDEWFIGTGQYPEHYTFIPLEGRRIIERYGNHPSFCIYCNGNELRGDHQLLHDAIRPLKALRPDILYTLTANYDRPLDPCDDIFISVEADTHGMRGNRFIQSMGETLMTTYKEAVDGRKIPLISHEAGQFCVYPNIGEISQYTGNLYPQNLKVIENDLKQKGLDHKIEQFVQASGIFAARMYKEEIESFLRTEHFGGFQMLGIQDFPGQCSATVGVLDAFWNSKGVISEEAFRGFCNDVVPLIKTEKRIIKSMDSFLADIYIRQSRFEAMEGMDIRWTLNASQHIYAQGTFENVTIEAGTLQWIGQTDNIDLSDIDSPKALTMTVEILGTNYSNSWNLWVYPEIENTDIELLAHQHDIHCVSAWNPKVKKMLEDGKNVLLMANKDSFIDKKVYDDRFNPVFWSPVFFNSEGSYGFYFEQPEQLRYFPSDHYTDYQWYHLLEDSFNFSVDHLPPEITPMIEVTPNFYYNHRLTNLIAAQVGRGRLMITSLPVERQSEHVEVKWFKKSLIDYIGTVKSETLAQLTFDEVDKIFIGDTKEAMDKTFVSTEGFIG